MWVGRDGEIRERAEPHSISSLKSSQSFRLAARSTLFPSLVAEYSRQARRPSRFTSTER
jgi:hypothetical protein